MSPCLPRENVQEHIACDVSPYPFFFLMGCFQQFFVFFVGPYMRPPGLQPKGIKKFGRKQHVDLVKGQKSKSLPDLPGQKDVADNKLKRDSLLAR